MGGQCAVHDRTRRSARHGYLGDLGYGSHDPAGRNSGNSATAPWEDGAHLGQGVRAIARQRGLI
jgi:hypothetical protein